MSYLLDLLVLTTTGCADEKPTFLKGVYGTLRVNTSEKVGAVLMDVSKVLTVCRMIY